MLFGEFVIPLNTVLMCACIQASFAWISMAGWISLSHKFLKLRVIPFKMTMGGGQEGYLNPPPHDILLLMTPFPSTFVVIIRNVFKKAPLPPNTKLEVQKHGHAVKH